MSSTKNQAKAQFLGMPHGTANQRLRKMILFNLLQKLKEDNCFVCGLKIESIVDLSIEHKLPWEGRSVELFWDLSNIAFSHLRCNRPHSNGSDKKRKPVAAGNAWCSDCQSEKPRDKFPKDPTKWSGLSNRCKPCKSIQNARRPTTLAGRQNARIA